MKNSSWPFQWPFQVIHWTLRVFPCCFSHQNSWCKTLAAAEIEKSMESSRWCHHEIYSSPGHLGMDQYLLIPFLVGWTSIYQLFWCSPGIQGFDTLPFNVLKSLLKPLSWVFGSRDWVSRFQKAFWVKSLGTPWVLLFDKTKIPRLYTSQLASGYVKQFAIENDHRNSGFSHWKWWIFP